MAKKLVILSATLAVLIPIIVHLRNVSWSNSSLAMVLFPVFGILAFTLLWLHSMAGVFEVWLRERFDFDFFVHWSSLVILVSMIAHPLLLLILIKFNFSLLFSGPSRGIIFGIIGLALLLTYDLGKMLKKWEFFSRNWNAILIVSTIGTIFIFFHSLMIGSDLQSGWTRKLWIFYGVTAILGTIYTYGVKKYLK